MFRINANRRGHIFADRYFARPLRTPLEVRRALVYVLQNHRHHAGVKRCASLDPLSSAPYFDVFENAHPRNSSRDPPVVSPTTWLLRIGWRRHGLLNQRDAPSSGG